MSFEDLKDSELQEKLKSCKSASELASIAYDEGMELTDEQLDGIAGGGAWSCECTNNSDGSQCRDQSW